MRKEITFDSPEQFAKCKKMLDELKKICPNKECGGKGHVVIEKEDGTYFRDCPECTGKLYKIIDYLKCNINNDYIEHTLADLKIIAVPEFYKRFQQIYNKIQFLVLKYSLAVYIHDDGISYGSGSAATILFKRLIDLEYEGASIDFARLKDTVFNFEKDKTETNIERAKLRDKLLNIPILLIDAFNLTETEKFALGGFAYNKMTEFLNDRKTHGRFTIIATNYTRKQLHSTFQGSLATIIENNYLPIEVQTISGKFKHSPIAKLSSSDPDLANCFKLSESKTISVKNSIVPIANIPEDTSLDNIGKDRPTNVRTKR
jgi:hypothetical protein